MEPSKFQQTAYDIIQLGREDGLLLDAGSESKGRVLQLGDERLLHFGSCSYLGLETDPRLIAGVHRAVDALGTQYSSSRAYVSASPYRSLEAKLSRLFGGHALVSASTTLGHLSSFPVLVQERDAIVIDHQAHASAHLGVTQAKAGGTTVRVVRHGDVAALERAIDELVRTKRRVWYVLDGVYSMFGDLPDVEHLRGLLARYESLWLYVDDAHGTSIAGEHGRGVHLARMGHHPRQVVTASLNKAFAGAGGCLILPSAELMDRIRCCGPTMVFGGPVQPPMLGALHASADIHLSDEIVELQAELRERVSTLDRLLRERELPLFESNEAPMFFLQTGLVELGVRLLSRLRHEERIYLNLAVYPAVPLRRSGLRVAVTRHHRHEDLVHLADALARQYPSAMSEVGFSRADIDAAFARATTAPQRRHARIASLVNAEVSTPRPAPSSETGLGLVLEHHHRIADLDAAEWDRLLGDRGSFDAATLGMLESVFGPGGRPEDDWSFHYYVIRDGRGRPVLATFFTEALWKDDMLMRAEVSRLVEERRRDEPHWLSSRCLAMGSLVSEGDHLYLDRSGPWRAALRLLLDRLGQQLEASSVATVVLRDLAVDDAAFDELVLLQGYVKVPLLESHVVAVPRGSLDDWIAALPRRHRKVVKPQMLEAESRWEVRIHTTGSDPPDDGLLDVMHQQYLAVARRNLGLNVFPLPRGLLTRIRDQPGWEIICLHHRDENDEPSEHPLAFGVCHVGPRLYTALYCGLDYARQDLGGYRQLLWQVLGRARAHGLDQLALGMGADVEKRRLSSRPRSQCVYLLTTDHYNATVLDQLSSDAALARSLVG